MVTWSGFAPRLGRFMIAASLASVGVALAAIVWLATTGQPLLPGPAHFADLGPAWWLAVAGLSGLGLTPIAMLLGCIRTAARLQSRRTVLFSLGVLAVIALGAITALSKA